MTDLNINQGKFILVNETGGGMCYVCSDPGRMIASRSTCYRVKKYMSSVFPECKYAVYRLVKLG